MTINFDITDNFKTLSRRYGYSISDLRAIADDLDLRYDYSSERKTWYLAENATTVRHFNDVLEQIRLK